MPSSNYTIRTMSRAELEVAVEWAAAEGWNPGLHDAECYFAADPNGFLVGVLDGEPIASISVVKYDESFGFLGFYIVKPEYRGKGYGMALWQAGLAYFDGCNIGLDGVVAQQENYKHSGFSLAYRNIRFEGVGGGEQVANANIISLANRPVEQVVNYSRAFFPAERSEFLTLWIQQAGSQALGILQDGELAGYGVIRECRSGFKIGPLFADSAELAESLFIALKSQVKASETIYLDVPESNQAAVELAKRYGMTPSFETARMYTKEMPDLSLDRTFGVTSFEIG